MKHLVNLSGGKDSTAMLLLMLEKGLPIDHIIFADTGKDFSQMLDHLDELERYIVAKHNAPKITRLLPEKSFDYWMFDHVKTKGKAKGSCGYGWSTMWARWCTSHLKKKVLDGFAKSLGEPYMHYIGFAVDEPKRLRDIPTWSYPLVDWGMTEAEALQVCYDRGFQWGGLYEHFDRVSCWCCPLKNLRELKTLWKYHPELWVELKDMDTRANNQIRADYSVADLERKFAKEEADSHE